MKKFVLLSLLLGISPGLVFALGLGDMDVDSALNEPFSARIELLSVSSDELDSIIVGLADREAFSRAGIERPFLLSQLKFVLQHSEDGSSYVRIYTQKPILEPFLNFLVEVNWARGRLFREYTVLLDPPLYDPNVSAKKSISVAPVPAEIAAPVPTEIEKLPEPDSSEPRSRQEAVRFDETDSQPEPGEFPLVSYAGGDYGPAQSSDTLWSIASATRPNNSVSINQMMLALLRTNPDAFLNQNINGLKRGQVLKMPDESELNRLGREKVLAEVRSQHALWADIRGTVTEKVAERPAVSSGAETSAAADADDVGATVTEIAGSEAELKLVAASTDGAGGNQSVAEDTVSGFSEGLALAQESIQALTQENAELKDRIQESEILIEDLKRFISLKDDELNLLESQIARQKAEEEEAAAIGDDAEPVGEAAATGDDAEPVGEAAATGDDAEPVGEAAATEDAAEPVGEATAAEDAAEPVGEAAATEDAAEPVGEATATEDAAEPVGEAVATEDAAEPAGEAVATEDAAEEPVSGSTGIIGTVMEVVNTYLTPVKEIVMGNLKIVIAVVGALLLAIVIRAVVMKFKAEPAQTIEIDPDEVSSFTDAVGDMGTSTGIDVEFASEGGEDISGMEDVDSEAITDVPDAGESERALSESDAQDEEEDPLQEVNTYLAFEQYDQAEEFVRDIIKQDPDNPESHLKLLEVFYTSGNKTAYEESARIVHDLVNGGGEYWDMATAMWSELSPDRELFAESAGVDEPDSAVEDITGGGMVDIAADEDNAGGGIVNIATDQEAPAAGIVNIADDKEVQNEGLDFDMGVVEEESASQTAAESFADEAMLDAGEMHGDELEGSLDITDLSDGEEELSMTDQDGEEGIVDLTEIEAADSFDEGLLEMETEPAQESIDEMVDMTEIETADSFDEGLLEMETEPAQESIDEMVDLTEIETADSFDEGLLEMETEPAQESLDETVEFDLATNAEDVDETDDQNNVVDFDLASAKSPEAESDVGDATISFDMDSVEDDDETVFDAPEELVDTPEENAFDAEDAGDAEDAEDAGLDVSGSDDNEVDLSDDDEVDFDFNLEEEGEEGEEGDDAEPSEAMFDTTVRIPRIETGNGEDGEGDGADTTVFVPRSSPPDEQSIEDEIATKLDLAKAYVELDNKDSAKKILDEVIIEGNDEQKRQAEELLSQV